LKRSLPSANPPFTAVLMKIERVILMRVEASAAVALQQWTVFRRHRERIATEFDGYHPDAPGFEVAYREAARKRS